MPRPTLLLALLLLGALAGAMATPPTAASSRPQLDAAVTQILADRDSELQRLHARFASARDEAEALQIQREIEQLERRTETALLQLQKQALLAHGHADEAARLEAALKVLEVQAHD